METSGSASDFADPPSVDDLPYIILPAEERRLLYDYKLDYTIEVGDVSREVGEIVGIDLHNDPLSLLEGDMIKFKDLRETEHQRTRGTPWLPSQGLSPSAEFTRKPQKPSEASAVPAAPELLEDSFRDIQTPSIHPFSPEVPIEYELPLYPSSFPLSLVAFDRRDIIEEDQAKDSVFQEAREECKLFINGVKEGTFHQIPIESNFFIVELQESSARYTAIKKNSIIKEKEIGEKEEISVERLG